MNVGHIQTVVIGCRRVSEPSGTGNSSDLRPAPPSWRKTYKEFKKTKGHDFRWSRLTWLVPKKYAFLKGKCVNDCVFFSMWAYKNEGVFFWFLDLLKSILVVWRWLLTWFVTRLGIFITFHHSYCLTAMHSVSARLSTSAFLACVLFWLAALSNTINAFWQSNKPNTSPCVSSNFSYCFCFTTTWWMLDPIDFLQSKN